MGVERYFNGSLRILAVIALIILAWDAPQLSSFDYTMITGDFKVLGFMPYWILNYTPRYEYLNYIAWFAVEVNGQGEIVDLHGWPPTELIEEAHHHNVKVMLTVACFHSDSIDRILAYNSEKLSQRLLQIIRDGDGIVIDFEGVRKVNSYTGMENMALLANFMRTLKGMLKNASLSLQTCICLPPVDWNGVFNCTVLTNYVDMFFIMAYDYHWKYDSVSGPVSPFEGEEYCVKHTLDYYLEQAPPSKFILGLPLYGWDWPTKTDRKHSETLGPGSPVVLRDAVRKVEIYGRRWDYETKSAWYAYKKDGVWHQCWYEDPESLMLKYRLAKSRRLEGVGFWALGFEGDITEIYEALPNGTVNPNPLGWSSEDQTEHGIYTRYQNIEA